MEEAFPAVPRKPADFVILVIDDEDDIRLLIDYTLKKEGFQTVLAANGNEAFAKLEARAPDMIFLDLMMPGQSGYEFLRHLQGTQYARIPVVIATARMLDTSTVAVILQEANVVEFFAKPFQWPLILSSIHTRLNTERPAPRPRDKPSA
jgi:two-component system OmpR family response regulator/two-component system alkaline phosphatase synthesis response regulator PhoP